MDSILSGLVFFNDTDIFQNYGAFLVENQRGGLDNITELLTPSSAKADTAVNIREENGERYSDTLTPANEPRDVTLHFAIYAPTQQQWFSRFKSFISFLKQGDKGWISAKFPQLGLTLRLKYSECTTFTPLTYLWHEGVHAAKFKVKFREPQPVI